MLRSLEHVYEGLLQLHLRRFTLLSSGTNVNLVVASDESSECSLDIDSGLQGAVESLALAPAQAIGIVARQSVGSAEVQRFTGRPDPAVGRLIATIVVLVAFNSPP